MQEQRQLFRVQHTVPVQQYLYHSTVCSMDSIDSTINTTDCCNVLYAQAVELDTVKLTEQYQGTVS